MWPRSAMPIYSPMLGLSFFLLSTAGLRSFDMCSDWAFYTISLQEDGAFAIHYEGDFETLRRCSFAFCILGLLLWIPDM